MRHFLTLRDFSKYEILSLVEHASELKKNPKKLLQDKTLAMILKKTPQELEWLLSLLSQSLVERLYF